LKLVWYRSDLRTIDCAPLAAACADDSQVCACFLISPAQWKDHGLGPNRIEYLRRTLGDLAERLADLNIPLRVRTVDRFEHAPAEILSIAEEEGCTHVHWGREYEVNELERDASTRRLLVQSGIEVEEHDDQVVVPPASVRTGSGTPYKVFTPYRKAWMPVATRAAGQEIPRPAPRTAPRPELPGIPGSIEGFGSFVPIDDWPVGEVAALEQLDAFIMERGADYQRDRDIPSVQGTSRLGPALATGALSPRTCIARAFQQLDKRTGSSEGLDTWISEIAWRDFYRNVLFEFPHVCRNRAFKPATEQVAWRDDEDAFKAWCEGRTGYPIVDAAMRGLVRTGWMHNRLRMVTSQFLSKHLLIDWRRGEAFFAHHLIDMDFASNNGGWQWSSSTGTDSAPYFRVFNPTTQGRRFDPEGTFIREWIPEIAHLSDKAIHEPSLSGDDLWNGADYPEPIVDQSIGRKRAIEAFAVTRTD
jgi:deoxyribodipyrimidine photo-lyase